MNKNQTLGGTCFFVGAIVLLAFCFCSGAFAQSGTSTVRGTVADAQGNVVAGATVTLINAEKNFSRTQTTNEQGGYVFSAVPPDVYRIEVEGSGFKKLLSTTCARS